MRTIEGTPRREVIPVGGGTQPAWSRRLTRFPPRHDDLDFDLANSRPSHGVRDGALDLSPQPLLVGHSRELGNSTRWSSSAYRVRNLAEGLCNNEPATGRMYGHFSPGGFVEDAFGDVPAFQAIVAERDRVLAGYALFHDAYEPAFTARGVYLADIYVRPELRRNGIARALLSAVAREAARRRRTFIWWVARTDEARAFHRAVANIEQPVTAHAVTFAAFDRLLGSSSTPLNPVQVTHVLKGDSPHE